MNIVYVVEGLICLFLGAVNDGPFEVAVANLIFESETVHFHNAGQGLVRRDIRKESTLLLQTIILYLLFIIAVVCEDGLLVPVEILLVIRLRRRYFLRSFQVVGLILPQLSLLLVQLTIDYLAATASSNAGHGCFVGHGALTGRLSV